MSSTGSVGVAENVLFVDDERNILHAVERLFMDCGFRVLTADTPLAALKLVDDEEVAVIVSDNLMPGMRGVELLARVRQISPDTVKILMTAYADLSTAVDAINTGEVFRFVVKPWDDSSLLNTVRDAVDRYRLTQSMRKADEATLLSLAQTIELKDRYTRGHCDRVANFALMIAGALDFDDTITREIKYGSWLHDCGKIGVPESILNYPGPLQPEEYEVIKKHPVWGADVARQAMLPERVINIILYHHEKYGGDGYPEGRRGDDIPLEARIVSIADVFDAMTSDRPHRKAYGPAEAEATMTSLKGSVLDPALVDLFLPLLPWRAVAQKGAGR